MSGVIFQTGSTGSMPPVIAVCTASWNAAAADPSLSRYHTRAAVVDQEVLAEADAVQATARDQPREQVERDLAEAGRLLRVAELGQVPRRAERTGRIDVALP